VLGTSILIFPAIGDNYKVPPAATALQEVAEEKLSGLDDENRGSGLVFLRQRRMKEVDETKDCGHRVRLCLLEGTQCC
jgi:hypothetical protein